MKQSVYIDTSVIGGCFDKEFEEWSNQLFEDFKNGIRIPIVSDVTIDELSNAPEKVRNKFYEIPEASLEFITNDEESKELADQYILEKAITEKYYEDALHIAIATIHQVSVLSSWNFNHIVNLDRIRFYNAVNIKNGYSYLEIRTPREIVKTEDNEN
jgi:predicted nucleic acid-binding protein